MLFLLNIHAEIINKITPNQIQECIKSIRHCDQIGFILGEQGILTSIKQLMQYSPLVKKIDKNYMIFSVNRNKPKTDKTQNPFMIKFLKY